MGCGVGMGAGAGVGDGPTTLGGDLEPSQPAVVRSSIKRTTPRGAVFLTLLSSLSRNLSHDATASLDITLPVSIHNRTRVLPIRANTASRLSSCATASWRSAGGRAQEQAVKWAEERKAHAGERLDYIE